MCELILRQLVGASLPFAVFGSAAGDVYGWSRPPRDIDLFVGCDSVDELAALLPSGERIAPNGLRLGHVEVWTSPLVLRTGRRAHAFPFDEALAARRVPHANFHWVLGPEDQLAIKATLRRERNGKCDLEDARSLVRHWGSRLDRDYLSWRAARCGVTDLVVAVVP